MKLKDQVCSLELSKQLKELEVKQESLFVWYPAVDGYNCGIWNEPTTADIVPEVGAISAFTVAELGEMLPMMIKNGYLELGNDSYGWFCAYRKEEADWDTKDVVGIVRDKNEANARAKMLVYLLEHKVINL